MFQVLFTGNLIFISTEGKYTFSTYVFYNAQILCNHLKEKERKLRVGNYWGRSLGPRGPYLGDPTAEALGLGAGLTLLTLLLSLSLPQVLI